MIDFNPHVRPWLTVGSLAATGAGAALVLLRSERLFSLIALCLITGLITHTLGLASGSSAIIGVAIGLLAVGATIEIGLSGDGIRLTTVVVGVLWYLGAELAWEDFERRDGSVRTRAALYAWLRDLAMVGGIALCMVVAAALGAGSPPTRSLPLQLLALVAGLGGLAALNSVRGGASRSTQQPPTE